MTAKELVARYPRLWHMADMQNALGIVTRGLLCTSALLDLYGVSGIRRSAIERRHRPYSVVLTDTLLGEAVIRDQRPMSTSRVAASLTDASPEQFFRFLNGRVFFWLAERRLATMNAARAYRDRPQLVLSLDTSRLVKAYEHAIRLSPINSGATSPFAWPRSIGMFKRIRAFDYAARLKAADPIAELTVDHGVPDIMKFVDRMEIWKGGNRERRLNRPYDATLAARVLVRGRS